MNIIETPTPASTCVALGGPGSKCMITSSRGAIVVVTVLGDMSLKVETVAGQVTAGTPAPQLDTVSSWPNLPLENSSKILSVEPRKRGWCSRLSEHLRGIQRKAAGRSP